MSRDQAQLRTNIGRRLQILDYIVRHEARGEDGVGVIAVSDELGREKTQISRGLAALTSCGLAERDPDTREFVAGARLLDLAANAGRPTLLRHARRPCQATATKLGERVHLDVLAGDHVLTVETFAAVASVQAVVWVGMTAPLHCSAAGRALLFDADDDTIRDRVNARSLRTGLAAAPRTFVEIRSRIDQERQTGVATAIGELEDDLASAAAPIRDRSARIIAALTVSGPKVRIAEQIERYAHAVRDAAERLRENR